MKKSLTQEILAIISLLHIHLIIDSTWNHIGCYIYIAIYELLMIESIADIRFKIYFYISIDIILNEAIYLLDAIINNVISLNHNIPERKSW